MLVITALLAGAFAFTITLWVTGVGTVSADAVSRLGRLREADPIPEAAGPTIGLRRRASVSLGGINVISTGLAAKWTNELERGGLALNVREYLMLRLAVSAAIGVVLAFLLPMPVLGVLAAPLGYLLVGMWLKRRIKSRLKKLENQLVELLQMLSSGLRAGFGLIQAMESSADQLPEPLSIEIRRTLRDTAMGASIDQALSSLNDRIGSPDFDIVITAVLIQRSVGGNLAEILDSVAHTMRERARIKGEINTLTSQQRMTGYVIGMIPIGLGGIFMVISPDYMKLMFTETLGHVMLGGAVLLEGVGFAIISKIVNIEV